MESLLTIALSSLLGSGTAVALIKFFVERHDNKVKDAKAEKENEALKKLKTEFQGQIQEVEQVSEENSKNIAKLTEMVTKILNSLDENQKHTKTINQSLIGLNHERLVYLSDRISKRKAITLKEKSILSGLYLPYSELNQTGKTEKIGYEYCMQLPVVTDEEASNLDIRLKKRELGLA